MAIDYVDLASKAQVAVEGAGKSITLVEKSKGTPLDGAKPWRKDSSTLPGETTVAVIAVEDQFELGEVDGSSIRLGDKKYLVAADSVLAAERTRMTEYDLIRDGSETWRIRRILPIEPGSVPVLFTFHVSKLGREDVG